jgi:hypothetical protein
VQRDRQQAAEPNRWIRPQSPDRAVDAESPPHTAALMDGF